MGLVPAFQLNLQNAIMQHLAAVGWYDGKHPSLTCGTSSGKVFIHSPHDKAADRTATGVRFLNINRKVTALATGCFDKDTGKWVVLIGTETNLLAYDVEGNSDVFYKDVPDGVHRVVFGSIPSVGVPLAIVGGHCSVQGFDIEGTESFWTVTGDNVSALALVDTNGDGVDELVVGSDDFEIRIFKDDDVLEEVTETDKILDLCPIAASGSRFGYALSNGTVGVYDNTSRLWRLKAKSQVSCITSYDIDADGVPELITGWTSGKIDARREHNAELVYKDSFAHPVSAMVKADYRLDGREDLICCALDGEVRGYLPADADTREALLVDRPDERLIKTLQDEKAKLELELRGLESNMKSIKTGEVNPGAIPPTTAVHVERVTNTPANTVDLVVSTNNDTVIKSVIVYALDGGLFEGESLLVHPPTPQSSVRVPLMPPKNVAADLKLQVLVGALGSSSQYHVFEKDHRLPRFASFEYKAVAMGPPPASTLTFNLTERMNRVFLWLQENFVLPDHLTYKDILDLSFVSVRDGSPLRFTMTPDGGGTVTIKSDDMDTVAEIVQDLCSKLGVFELESVAEFPSEMDRFREVLVKVDELNVIRLKLTAEMADNSNLVKSLVIKAEDARILGDMPSMRHMYAELYAVNNELIGEYTKRATNHQELLGALKEVNQMIQKAAKMRVGTAKTRVVSACRAAIKSNSIRSLFHIIKQGRAPPSAA